MESEEAPSAFYYFQALLDSEKAVSAHRPWSLRDEGAGALPRDCFLKKTGSSASTS